MKQLKLNRRVPVLAFLLTWAMIFSGLGVFAQEDDEQAIIKLFPYSQAARQQLLDWNLKTLVLAYEQCGHTNAAWDAPAKTALAAFAHLRAGLPDTNGPWDQTISNNCVMAVRAGCDDPMVEYLRLRFVLINPPGLPWLLVSAATNLCSSSYPTVRKFSAAFRALDSLNRLLRASPPRPAFSNPPMDIARRQMTTLMTANLEAALHDKTIPAHEAYVMANAVLNLAEEKFEYPLVQEWIQPFYENFGDDYTAYLLKGKTYIKLAWFARGGGYADTVTDQGWKEFNDDLDIAREALEHAWLLNSTDIEIPHAMQDVVLGQAPEAKDMEIWFNRAMEIDTNDIQACRNRLYYLEPKWNGSDEQQIAFGRWCATSKKWGGNVPLMLIEAHTAVNKRNPSEIQADYWKRKDVWADVQTAFNRYIELNPDESTIYQVYAAYAYKAEQWATLNELIPKIKDQYINYKVFAGQAGYQKMLALAAQHKADK